MIIAIDGTSGSGKSTLAKKIAEKLNFGFFSAGALYRAITYKVMNLHISEDDDESLTQMINSTKIIYTYDGNKNVMELDGLDITDKLYTEEISNLVSKIACKPFVREFVRGLQRETSVHNENVVMEGRDIGSVIFPNADLKVFVDCNVEERAKRRMIDYKHIGENVPLEKVVADLEERDYRDKHRSISPLVMCQNALLIDTTNLTAEQSSELVFKEMLKRNIVDIEFFKSKGIDISL